MNRYECEYESEVLAAVLQSRWPEHAEAALREHAAVCPICSEVATVAGAVGEMNESTSATVAVPDAGQVWWRVQMRARREAVQAAGRPITAAQVLAFAVAVGLVGACFGATSTWFQSVFSSVRSTVAGLPWDRLIASITTLAAEHAALVLLIAAVLVLIPAGLCVSILRD